MNIGHFTATSVAIGTTERTCSRLTCPPVDPAYALDLRKLSQQVQTETNRELSDK